MERIQFGLTLNYKRARVPMGKPAAESDVAAVRKLLTGWDPFPADESKVDVLLFTKGTRNVHHKLSFKVQRGTQVAKGPEAHYDLIEMQQQGAEGATLANFKTALTDAIRQLLARKPIELSAAEKARLGI